MKHKFLMDFFSISSYVIGWTKTSKSRWRQLATGFHINSQQVCFRFNVSASRLLLPRCLPAYEGKPDCCVGIAMNIYPGQLFGNIVGLITMWTKNVRWPKMVLSIWNMREGNQKIILIMSSLKLCGHLILLVMRIFMVCKVCREVFIDIGWWRAGNKIRNVCEHRNISGFYNNIPEIWCSRFSEFTVNCIISVLRLMIFCSERFYRS